MDKTASARQMDRSSQSRLTRRHASGLLATAAAAMLLSGCSDHPTGPRATFSANPANSSANQAMKLIDRYRVGLGCQPLRWHASGATVAESYSRQMSEERFFGHIDPAGRTLKHRLNAAGIMGYRKAAETIAAGQETPELVVGAWKASPAHHEIVKDCSYTRAAIGFHEGDGPYRVYWTALYFE
jgi:uncharacterized protein YkwD